MTVEELFKTKTLINKLKSLELELRTLNEHNFYGKNNISDMPSGGERTDELAWYVDEKLRIEEEMEKVKGEIQRARETIDTFLNGIEDCSLRDIVRFRVINDLNYEEIGKIIGYSRATVWKRFVEFEKSLN